MAKLPAADASIAAYQAYVKEELAERGFADESVAQKFMLFVEEVGEFAKAARKKAHIKTANETVEANLTEEAGDVLILFLDLCNKLDVDAAAAFLDKESKNKQRTWQ